MSKSILFEISPIDEVVDVIVEIFSEHICSDEMKDSYAIEIENQLSNFIETELDENLYCLIEYPYVDKVYRDSYYSYFSSKHYNYKRDCIRVSLFKNEITAEYFSKSKNHILLQNLFLGYFVIRPLKTSLFGRSHINPEALKIKTNACSFKAESMILGVKLNSAGFPHSSQDEETISCAETTIWGLMEYFGNKYAEYRPALPSEIISTLKNVSFERQLPTIGLTVNQISFALKEFGFGTRIYSKDTYGKEFNKIINYYIESGIPIVLGLETENFGHAVVAIGRNEINVQKRVFDTLKYNGEEIEYLDYASINEKIIIQDDNHRPYLEVTIDNVGEFYSETDEMSEYEVKSVVVPLYPKIYLEATIAKEIFLRYLTMETFGYKFENQFTFRMFLASSRSFKSHISKMDKLNSQLKYDVLKTKMPKFIWCAEFYNKNKTINSSAFADGIIILDATEANHKSLDSLILASYPDRSIFMVDNYFVSLDQNLEGYKYYSNLN